MTARFANKNEIENWDNLLRKNSPYDTIFSTHEYAEIKILTGYRPRFIVSDKFYILALEKDIWPLGKFWYLPKGPNVGSVNDFNDAMNEIGDLASSSGVSFIRAESELPLQKSSELEALGYVKSTPVIPSQSTILLDISSNIDVILTTLPQKSRYSIRRAERDGVTVHKVSTDEENCKIMYNLLEQTALGQFGIRGYDYYKNYWQKFSRANMGQLFFAKYEGRVVAGAFALYFNQKSTYKDGASVRDRSAYGASHLLQWEIIKWAKENGSKIHDLCGSPPSSKIHDKTHPHYNIGLFKTSFNKTVTDYIGCYDMVINAKKYKIWNKIGERVHKKIYRMKTNDYYY